MFRTHIRWMEETTQFFQQLIESDFFLILETFPKLTQQAVLMASLRLFWLIVSKSVPLFRRLFFHTPPLLTSFKEATIIPVFKTGDISFPSNYHPISLTSVLSKVIEKIIRKQMLTFLSHLVFQKWTILLFYIVRCVW